MYAYVHLDHIYYHFHTRLVNQVFDVVVGDFQILIFKKLWLEWNHIVSF